MSRLDPLTKALATWDAYKDIVWSQTTNKPYAAIVKGMEAARKFEAGKNIWWCENHERGGDSERCTYLDAACHMVPQRLCPPIDPKEE